MSERPQNTPPATPRRGLLRTPPPRGQATRIAGLVRAHFALGPEWIVSVSELQCLTPGCPPVETVALLWDAAATPHRLRLFKPLPDVAPEDLPPRWYLPALAIDGDDDGACC